MTKKTIIILVIVGVFVPFLGMALEVSYPTFGGTNPGNTGGVQGPAKWILWIFWASMALVGVAAVGSLIYAGIRWMTATSSSGIADAKSRIWAALLGILVVVGSYVLLTTINPDLVNLNNPSLDSNVFQQPTTATGPAIGDLNGDCKADGSCNGTLICDPGTNKCTFNTGTTKLPSRSPGCTPATASVCQSGVCEQVGPVGSLIPYRCQ